MIPTPRLRFIDRKYQLSAFYRDVKGGPAYQTVRVLQQWWESRPSGVAEGGEWRDVPIEDETTK